MIITSLLFLLATRGREREGRRGRRAGQAQKGAAIVVRWDGKRPQGELRSKGAPSPCRVASGSPGRRPVSSAVLTSTVMAPMLTSDIVRVHPVCVHGFVRVRISHVVCVWWGGGCVRARPSMFCVIACPRRCVSGCQQHQGQASDSK